MSVKILGGKAKGLPLFVPESKFIRPTSVLLRRRFFDSKQNLEGTIFVDLCAGSGAMGLEAASRGADEIYFVENNKTIFSALTKNCQKFKEFHQALFLQCMDSANWAKNCDLSLYQKRAESLTIFIDPPYENHLLYTNIITALLSKKVSMTLMVESDLKKGPSLHSLLAMGLNESKLFQQGDNFLVISDHHF